MYYRQGGLKFSKFKASIPNSAVIKLVSDTIRQKRARLLSENLKNFFFKENEKCGAFAFGFA